MLKISQYVSTDVILDHIIPFINDQKTRVIFLYIYYKHKETTNYIISLFKWNICQKTINFNSLNIQKMKVNTELLMSKGLLTNRKLKYLKVYSNTVRGSPQAIILDYKEADILYLDNVCYFGSVEHIISDQECDFYDHKSIHVLNNITKALIVRDGYIDYINRIKFGNVLESLVLFNCYNNFPEILSLKEFCETNINVKKIKIKSKRSCHYISCSDKIDTLISNTFIYDLPKLNELKICKKLNKDYCNALIQYKHINQLTIHLNSNDENDELLISTIPCKKIIIDKIFTKLHEYKYTL